MPKYRQLHTKIIDSFDFNEMPDDFTRVVWMLLTLILDSEGRGIDNPCWIKSKMFPLRYDVTDEQISNAFAWLAEREMIQRYSVNGRRYFCIPTFKDYQSGTQKEAKSLFPSPPRLLQTNSGETPEQVRVAESESESESESNHYINVSSLIMPMIARVSGMASIPPKEMQRTEQLISMVQSYGLQETENVLKNCCDRWRKTPRKNGSGFYSVTNMGWVDWAQDELVGKPPEKKFEDCVTVDEMIEWHNTHQA
jgi:hypothetical protein